MVRLRLQLLAVLVFLIGCDSSYESMSAPQVAQMSDAELCIARLTTAGGFVPMEMARRKVSCEDRRVEVLDRMLVLSQQEPYLSRPDWAAEFLPYRCDGIEARLALTPHRVERSFAGGTLSYNNPNQFILHLRNRTTKVEYFQVALRFQSSAGQEVRMGRIGPRGQTDVPIPVGFSGPDWARDSGCYAV